MDLDDAIQRVIQSQGYTIGPVQPPSLTDIGQLIEFLISLKHQAAAQRWLCGREYISDLDKALDRASDAFAKGRDQQTRKELRRFTQQLSDKRRNRTEDSREHSRDQDCDERPRVTEDAYYMLTANADYILSKLPKNDGGKHDDGKDRRQELLR
ncbi:MAG: hypothetical protein HKL90_07170 [Elusimicrobia bacterium]|nr:hypothetical protein [Elusimicrobiota bacterium]